MITDPILPPTGRTPARAPGRRRASFTFSCVVISLACVCLRLDAKQSISAIYDGGSRVFGIGWDMQLYEARWTGNTWAIGIIGGSWNPNAGLVAFYDNGVSGPYKVYGIGFDNSLYVAYWTGSAWAIGKIGGSWDPTTSLAMIFDGAAPRVYGIDSDKKLSEARWTGSAWAIGVIGGSWNPNAGLVAYYDNGVSAPYKVYGIGIDNSLYAAYWTGSAWTIGKIGGSWDPTTSLAMIFDGVAPRVYGIDSDKKLSEARWTGSTWAVGAIGGSWNPNAGLVAFYDNGVSGSFKVYGLGYDRSLYNAFWTGSAWTVGKIGGSWDPITALSAFCDNGVSGSFKVYGLGCDHSLYNAFWTGSAWTIGKIGGSWYSAVPSRLAYTVNPAVYMKGTAITPNTPSSTGGAVMSYSVSPALPAGLSLNSSTGAISGTPVVGAAATTYTVTATNCGGSTTASLSITVTDPGHNTIGGNVGAGGATLSAVSTSATTEVEYVITADASGNYVFPGLPVDTYLVTVSAQGFFFDPPDGCVTVSPTGEVFFNCQAFPEASSATRVKSGIDQTEPIRTSDGPSLKPFPRVSATIGQGKLAHQDIWVRDSRTGSGLQQARIRVVPQSQDASITQGWEEVEEITPDDAGRLRLYLTPGDYSIQVSAENYSPGASKYHIYQGGGLPTTVMLDPIEPPAEFREARNENERSEEGMLWPGVLQGRVVDVLTGKFLAGAKVEARGLSTETDEEGYFALVVAPGQERSGLLQPGDGDTNVDNDPDSDPASRPETVDFVVSLAGYQSHEVRNSCADPGGHLIIDLNRGEGSTVEDRSRELTGLEGRREDPEVFDQTDSAPPSVAGTPERAVLSETGWGHGDAATGSVNAVARVVTPLVDQPLPAGIRTPFAPENVQIRVGMNGCFATSAKWVLRLSMDSYVTNGLGAEWSASWNPQALRAGAIAYRSVGYYRIRHPLTSTYDICSTESCQAFEDVYHSSTADADRYSGGMALTRENIYPINAEYSGENNGWATAQHPGWCKHSLDGNQIWDYCGDGKVGSYQTDWPCMDDPVAAGHPCRGHGRGMSQDGSKRWGDQGKSWAWILNHYYNDNGHPKGMRSAFMGLEPVQGSGINGIGAVMGLDRRLEVYAGGTALASEAVPGGHWNGWTYLVESQGQCIISNLDGRLQIFGTSFVYGTVISKKQLRPGTDNWPDLWTNHGLDSCSEVAAGMNTDGTLQLFAYHDPGSTAPPWLRGVFTKRQTSPGSGTWGEWRNVTLSGGAMSPSPLGVAAYPDGSLIISLYDHLTARLKWNAQMSPSGSFYSNWGEVQTPAYMASWTAPQVVCNLDGSSEVFMVSSVGGVWRYHLGGSGSWTNMGISGVDAVSAVRQIDGTVNVFAVSGGHLYQAYQTTPGGSGWSAWKDLGTTAGYLMYVSSAVLTYECKMQLFMGSKYSGYYTLRQMNPDDKNAWENFLALGP